MKQSFLITHGIKKSLKNIGFILVLTATLFSQSPSLASSQGSSKGRKEIVTRKKIHVQILDENGKQTAS